MKYSHIALLGLFSVGMGIGQLILKFSAQRQLSNVESGWILRLISLFSDWTFLLGITMYATLLVFWVWLLTFLPLSRAYPFTLLSLVVAAIGSSIFFDEVISVNFVVGIVIIGIGLFVLSMG